MRANAAKIGAKVHQVWAVIAEHLGLKSALVANSEKDAAKKEEGQSDPAAADEEKVTAMTKEEIAALAAEVAKTASANAVAEAPQGSVRKHRHHRRGRRSRRTRRPRRRFVAPRSPSASRRTAP